MQSGSNVFLEGLRALAPASVPDWALMVTAALIADTIAIIGSTDIVVGETDR